MEPIQVLPLFPLNTVLFPGQVLPLHIFEPRYQEMIHECLDQQTPFGVVLIREGREVGETAEPYEVGTSARIQQVDQLDGGRMNIVCVGDRRFRIHQTFENRMFLTGTVDYWPWKTEGLPRFNLVQQTVYPLLVEYLNTLAQLSGTTVQLENLPQEPLALSCLAAIALRVTNREKQELLAAPTLLDLMHLTSRLLQRENRALRITSGVPAVLEPPDNFIHPN